MRKQLNKGSERGAAVLVTAISLLIAVTIVVIFSARVGLLDQRISGNQYRHQQAFANAEAGLDFTASFLRRNKDVFDGGLGWVSCAGNSMIFPCDIENADLVYGTIENGTIKSSIPVIEGLEAYMVKVEDEVVILGVGTSDDGTARSVVQASYRIRPLIAASQLPPLMIPTGKLSGNFNIVANPNGAGEGVPVSLWTKDTLETGGNWKTCDLDQFRDGDEVCMDTKGDGETEGDGWTGCACGDERSNQLNMREDIVLYPEADFPASPFFYVFGQTPEEVKYMAEIKGLVLKNCSAVHQDFESLSDFALVWIEGNCNIPANTVIGSRNKPIVLVVEEKLSIPTDSEVWGVLFALSDITLNGNPVLHGSLVMENPADLNNGNFFQVFDPDVFKNLKDPKINSILLRKKYSWRDF